MIGLFLETLRLIWKIIGLCGGYFGLPKESKIPSTEPYDIPNEP